MNLMDPQSIAAWYRIAPARHGKALVVFSRLWPQFAGSIAEAGRLLRMSADPRFAAWVAGTPDRESSAASKAMPA